VILALIGQATSAVAIAGNKNGARTALRRGNLAIHIPIGPSFPVSSTLSYGLTLFYNSKVWDWDDDPENGGAIAVPNRHSNAGMGWQISLGRLEPPNSYGNPTSGYVFEDADGSQHAMNGQLHPGFPATAAPGVFYSNDSSYLRTTIGSNHVESPDGTVRYFDGSGRIGTIADRFGNSVSITYYDSSAPSPCSSTDTAEWDIHDSQGNRHTYVCLANQFPLGSFNVPTNYPSVYNGQFITKVIVPAPPDANGASRTSTYAFNYAWEYVSETCRSNDQGVKHFPMLESLTLPDTSSYAFTYNSSSTDTCFNGTLASMSLPTGAAVNYAYTQYDEPVEPCSEKAWFNQVVGVASKTVSGPKIPTAAWTYAQSNNRSSMYGMVKCTRPSRTGTGTITSCVKAPPDRMTTTVTDPLGNVSEHFYSIWPGGASGLFDPADGTCQTVLQADASMSEHGVHDYEFGLPYTSDPSLANGAFLLSTRTYTASGYGNGIPSRSNYVTYEQELLGTCLSAVPWCTSGNRRVGGERTRNFDASGNEIDHSDVTRDTFDGLGHYRHEVLGGSFTQGTADITTAYNQRDPNVNPAHNGDGFIDSGVYPASFVMPSVDQPWVLETLSSITHTEDNSTAIEQRCYDPASGFLRASRVLRQRSDTEDATDLVTLRTSTGGNVTQESYFGGDIAANAPTTQTLCAFADAPATPEKVINHTYTTGVLATSQYSGASFYSVNRTIDRMSGLPLQSRGTDGLQTVFNYDTSFRLASIKPPGVAATTYTYTKASGSGSSFVAASVDEKTATAQAGTIERIYQYDSLGRLWREKRYMPDASWSLRETVRNATGSTTSVSEWQTLSGTESSFTPSHVTTFSDFDPFGRAGLVTAPDGNVSTMTYEGVSALTKSATIHLAAGDTVVPTRETYDRHGRLLSTTGASYLYDVGGRLRQVSMAGENGTQYRTFTYDRRGLLMSEMHPELGTSGGSSITYSNYDSLGQAHRRTRGGLDLAFDFDAAERITSVYPFGSSGTPWKQFVYDDPNGSVYPQCAGGICNGKVVAATRWNQYPDATHLQTVTQTWHYDSATGLANQSDYTVGLTGDAFRVQQTFNDAGAVASTVYPCRVSGTTCADTARTVSNSYTSGMLTGVGTWADTISYQASGMIGSVHHTNGVTETWTPDPNGMARPCSIISTSSAGSIVFAAGNPCGYALSGAGWTSGQYLYDGSGNVTQMGSTSYWYDAMNRLTGWTSGTAEGGTQSTYVNYDAYGNLLSRSTQACVAGGSCFQSSGVANQVSGTTNHYVHMTYDAAGNVTNDGRQFTYDPLGMMATATIGSRSFRYLYTAGDERIGIAEVTSPTSPTYTWTLRGFGNEILRNYRGTGSGMTWIEDEIWRGGSLLANERPSLTRHYALDHLGSPRLLTTSTGGFIGTQDFQPFGIGGTTDGGSLQFTGHERDMELVSDTTGNMPDYMHARYYDVGRGRFLAVDPGRTWERNRPQSWNRYPYASNSPVNRIDLDGQKDFIVVVGAQQVLDPSEVRGGNAWTRALARGPGANTIVSPFNFRLQMTNGEYKSNNLLVVRGDVTNGVITLNKDSFRGSQASIGATKPLGSILSIHGTATGASGPTASVVSTNENGQSTVVNVTQSIMGHGQPLLESVAGLGDLRIGTSISLILTGQGDQVSANAYISYSPFPTTYTCMPIMQCAEHPATSLDEVKH
jgi:RHS repeat-associated protein